MNSKEYWEKRERENLKHYITEESEYSKKIHAIYEEMLEYTQKEIDAFYRKYAYKEKITISEAKRRVSRLDIKEYERKAKRYVKNKDFSDRANEEMRIYNLTMKVNRLEMLKANIGLELLRGTSKLERFFAEILKGRTMDELKRQAGILGKTIQNNAKLADAIVNASFHNATFSDRLWMNNSMMKADLEKLITRGLIGGKNPRVLAKEIRRYYIGDTYLKNGKKGAEFYSERLMRTELARVQIDAQERSFKENGFELYQFHVNMGCCHICAETANTDVGFGKGIFKLDDLMPSKNAPPMHPFCRCSISPYEDSEEYEAWLDFLANGGTTEKWNQYGKLVWMQVGRNIVKHIEYNGIPDSWEKTNLDEQLMNINPSGFTDNCVNCSVAFEMRCRGYDVIANSKIKSLSENPFSCWIEPEIMEVEPENAFNYIETVLLLWGNNVRVQITVENDLFGHSFSAICRNKSVTFIDGQLEKSYNIDEIKDILSNSEIVRFCRVDNLELSDLGIQACKER